MNNFLKGILFAGILLLGLIIILSNLLGDKSIAGIYTYRIKNTTSDTLYIEKPYSEDSLYAEVVKINNVLCVKIEPHSDSNFHSEEFSSLNHNQVALSKWSSFNDTLQGFLNSNGAAFKFVFGIECKCKIEEDDNSILCTRIIDKSFN